MRVENNKGGKGNFGKQLLDGTKLALGNQLEKKTGNLLTNGFHYNG